MARTAAANPVSTLAPMTPAEAEAILYGLASVFQQTPERSARPEIPNLEPMYRTLVEQIPAVVFMAYLDRGIGEAYVSPRIEEALGFSRAEWLEDPTRSFGGPFQLP